ncbi:MAG: nuclear transport factor 2 family protein [Candidatus Pseudobacter hemicellulosilyticus]|uniref:Nuclear transport factor 2 family protein n=1 Tax=Candidatus Pseudobacter hemicellulosilyticus TaxID=3121375 RepID=A0AAJ6BHT8_9BACT|nr:MAG: nuclear transport factor 2 family protein [Pseudobacter sp.]
MTIHDIASRLAAYCRQGDYETAQKELFADNAVSIEPVAHPPFDKETHGLQAIMEKGRVFEDMIVEKHSFRVSEPLLAESSFAFLHGMDLTMKDRGRVDMEELCVYTVKDGKIISEQFFM